MDDVIYLDYNATTPVDPDVVEAMLPYLSHRYGNASSAHVRGYEARHAMEQARAQVADLLGATADEIVFTGGGSEGNNLALKGAVFARLDRGPHVIASAVEHPAILTTLAYLQQRFGIAVTLIPTDGAGIVDPESVANAICPETILISVMHANNETGALQDITAIGAIARDRGILFHVDAAQSAGKVPIDVREMAVDLMSVSGHKFYAPKGLGALYVRAGVQLDPLIHGSGQEQGLRAGTENVAGIVALGAAARIARDRLASDSERIGELRDLLHDGLATRVPGLTLNGHPTRRLPNTLNVSFPAAYGGDVLRATPGIAASTGAACHSGRTAPSAVLLAMGLARDRAGGAVRLSLGRWTSEDEIAAAISLLAGGYQTCAAAETRAAPA